MGFANAAHVELNGLLDQTPRRGVGGNGPGGGRSAGKCVAPASTSFSYFERIALSLSSACWSQSAEAILDPHST